MYRDLEAKLHDVFWDAEEGPSELDLLKEFHKLHPGRALELGCGSARLLLPLLADGLDIEGIDLSADMLELGREKAQPLNLKPTFYHGEIESLELPHTYATLSIPAFTFQLVTDPSRLLLALRTALDPDGWLYLTAFIPHAELDGDVPENEWYSDRDLVLPDETRATVETKHILDPEFRLLTREHRYALHSPTGKLLETHECSENIHWLEADELTAVLADHGFKVDQTIVNFDPEDGSPLEDATVFTLIAQRVDLPGHSISQPDAPSPA